MLYVVSSAADPKDKTEEVSRYYLFLKFISFGTKMLFKMALLIRHALLLSYPQFLDYTKSMGNDLSTPNPVNSFPGLKPGDRWILCAIRWREAYKERKDLAPKVFLKATNQKALKYNQMSSLEEMAIDKPQED